MQGGEWKGRRRPTRFRRFRRERLALIVLSAALIVFGLVKLIHYGADHAASRRTSDALRQVYREETPEETVLLTASPAPATPVPATPAPTVARATPVFIASPVPGLEAVAYPGNPGLTVGSRFKALRKQNRDIVGWLNIGDLLDEAVVQRDEVFYMDHDTLGNKNVNGAIFLDSGISLKTRPYTLILYGHNMKTGAMFGCLRNFENAAYYRRYPFITFDSMYEEGRYVIFAVGSVSTESHARHYVDLFALTSTDIRERQTAIDALKAASVHTCVIDVRPEDQLLILVTCVEKDEERRVVAARRIRDGEDEKELMELVERSRKR